MERDSQAGDRNPPILVRRSSILKKGGNAFLCRLQHKLSGPARSTIRNPHLENRQLREETSGSSRSNFLRGQPPNSAPTNYRSTILPATKSPSSTSNRSATAATMTSSS